MSHNTSLSRRLVVSGTLAIGTGLAAWPSTADPASTSARPTALSRGGFRYLVDRGSPFSGGVVAAAGHGLIRVRLREPAPLERGLDLVVRTLDAVGLSPSALAGLELRSPSIMSRPEFAGFNDRYLAALRSRGFLTDEVVPLARSDMVPLYDPPKTDVLWAFTYAAPRNARGAVGGPDFLLSGRPEYDDDSHVVAPGDVSPGGMNRKAGFVVDQLRRGVTALGGRWSDLTAAQIYMTEPLASVMEAMRAAGLTSIGLTVFPGSTPVVGLDGARYAFEADVRAIGFERVT